MRLFDGSPECLRAAVACRLFHVLQDDKGGTPYWRHPYSVAEMVAPCERQAALLHDVIEDTIATPDMLLGLGFSEDVVSCVEILTRTEGEAYSDYIKRVSRCCTARDIKVADLKHNLNPERQGATDGMRRRYDAALRFLSEGERKEQGCKPIANTLK